MEYLTKVTNVINDIVWSEGMLFLLIGTGIYFTVRSRFYQIRKFGSIIKHTIGSMFTGKARSTKSTDSKSISQFQALSTALAATMGTGNIAGVATALTLGGAGAIFWMWVSAILGMMTAFSENVLGIHYRYRGEKGEWIGGPMVYMEKGLGAKWLGVAYAILCMLASFGIGNMTQINSISTALSSNYSISPWLTGGVVAVIVGLVIFGGVKRISSITEKVIPIISIAYIAGAVMIIVINREYIPKVISDIFKEAFGINAAFGGISGIAIKKAVSVGLRRGVFSNEAGLGSSVLIHTESDVKSPIKQGMWAVFEVFADTIVCCTLTAFAILSTGVLGSMDESGKLLDGAALVIAAFSSGFGKYAGFFITVSIIIFALATLLGWSFYGAKAAKYTFGEKAVKIYNCIFVGTIMLGAVTELTLVWSISDTLNGMMAIPNLVAILLLSPVVISELKSNS